jgi:hypothetical protein
VEYRDGSSNEQHNRFNIKKLKQKIETKFELETEKEDNFDFYEQSRMKVMEQQWEEVYLKDHGSFTPCFLENSKEKELVELIFMFWVVLSNKIFEKEDNFDFYEQSRMKVMEQQWEEVYLKDHGSFTPCFLENSKEKELVELIFMFWVVLSNKIFEKEKTTNVYKKLDIFQEKRNPLAKLNVEKDTISKLLNNNMQNHHLKLFKLKKNIENDLHGVKDDDKTNINYKKIKIANVPDKIPNKENNNTVNYVNKRINCDLIQQFFYKNNVKNNSYQKPQTLKPIVNRKIRPFTTFFNKDKKINKKKINLKNDNESKVVTFNLENSNFDKSKIKNNYGGSKIKFDALKRFIKN